MMIGKFRLDKEWKVVEGRKPDEIMEVPASLGLTIGGTRLVEIPGRDGYVYARIRDQLSEVVNVYNDQVSPVYDLPVIIIRDRRDRNKWRVKGRDLGRYSNWGSTAYLPNHHEQHEFNPESPGGDIAWIYSQQFMPLAPVPSGSSGAMGLIVKDFTYYRNSTWNYFPGTYTTSFSSYKPTGSSNAKMVLLYLNTSDALAYSSGTEFAIVTGTANIISKLPIEPGDCFIPIGGIYLLTGTSTLTWGNIYEVRPFYTSTSTSSSSTGTSRFDDIYAADSKPVMASFTWANQASGTASDGAGGIFMYAYPDGNVNYCMLKKNTPGTPYTLDVGLVSHLYNVNYARAGMFLLQSSDNKSIGWGVSNAGNEAKIFQLISPTEWQGNVAQDDITPAGRMIWFRITDDGSTYRKYYWSADGRNWILRYTESRTEWITADRYGIFVSSENGSLPAAATFIYVKES